MPATPKVTQPITNVFGAPIRQYPGQSQVTRGVRVKAPGTHWTGLTRTEQQVHYWVCAMEFRERHAFQSHAKAWGQAHTGPGMRFVSEDDAIEDPDNRGSWTTLSLWNKWRDQTYRDDRDAELQYMDQLPAVSAANASSADKQSPAGARVKQSFTLVSEGTHTVSGNGKMAGQVLKCEFWACKKEGCARGNAKPIKQIGSGTADLYSHLDSCQPNLAQELRVASIHSPARIGEDGESVSA